MTKEHETQTANWGEAIQKEYTRFLRYGHIQNWEGWKVFTSGMYDQLVRDEFISPPAYKPVLPDARSSFISELQKKVALRGMGINAETDEIKVATLKGIVSNLQSEIEKYRNGDYEDRITLRAKQWTIMTLFRDAKKNNVVFIYKPEEE